MDPSNNLFTLYSDIADCKATTPILNMPFDEYMELPNSDYISSEVMELSDESTEWKEILDEIGEKNSNIYEFYPPPPPQSVETFNIGDGKFEYITNIYDREMLVNAWQAITQTNNWDFMIQDIESYMFSTDPRISIISRKMEQLGYNGHSGASFGCTMRNMQYLAQNGEKNFKKTFDKTYDT